AVGAIAALLALLPVAAWGALHHALPFLLVRAAAVRSAKLPDLWASGAVYSSLLVFPPFYAFEAVLAGLWLPLPWALVHLGTLPICGWLALVFRDRCVRDAARLRALALFRAEPRLQHALGAALLGLQERL